jgi:hypothetical protein
MPEDGFHRAVWMGMAERNLGAAGTARDVEGGQGIRRPDADISVVHGDAFDAERVFGDLGPLGPEDRPDSQPG